METNFASRAERVTTLSWASTSRGSPSRTLALRRTGAAASRRSISLNEAPPGGPFQFVFDRGCFHTFDEDHERARFAQNVAAVLIDGGVWLSLIGSTEGPPRDAGPPRRSARDVMNAIEPSLEILQFRYGEFGVCGEQLKAWLCLSRKRTIPAQPSSRH